jgi:hypothetical protein
MLRQRASQFLPVTQAQWRTRRGAERVGTCTVRMHSRVLGAVVMSSASSGGVSTSSTASASSVLCAVSPSSAPSWVVSLSLSSVAAVSAASNASSSLTCVASETLTTLRRTERKWSMRVGRNVASGRCSQGVCRAPCRAYHRIASAGHIITTHRKGGVHLCNATPLTPPGTSILHISTKICISHCTG